jgi:hypothetical protein
LLSACIKQALTSLRPFLHLLREVFVKAARLDKRELFLDEKKEEGRPNGPPLTQVVLTQS